MSLQVFLSLYDTAGEEDYDRLRPLSYTLANVVLMCFTIDNRDSFTNVQYKWEPEIRHYLGGVPIVLVGNKMVSARPIEPGLSVDVSHDTTRRNTTTRHPKISVSVGFTMAVTREL